MTRTGRLILIALCALTSNAFGATTEGRIDFNRDIRPILSENCYACHGPDKNKRKADLRLDTQEGLYSAPSDAVIVTPGKPDASELLHRIATDDTEAVMPPSKTGKTLKPDQIALVKKWIEQGAEWKGHWSYIAPATQPVPRVEDAGGFVRNDIDRFILAHLSSTGIAPSPAADRVTLIRRLSFDLTGLPPAPEDVTAFVEDDSASAYDKVVDRLLASKHYGERMAVYWLDLVRYADTVGYHGDQPREVSPYRDYVINAFNENKPFDRFTVEQLAGDLMPNATVQNKVASAYNRLLQTSGEGGAQAKEYIVKYAADRVRNASSVWLGATMACAECHDHKYDPFSQRDFYTFAAFFADIQEIPISVPRAELSIPDERQAAELARLDAEIAKLNQTLATPTPQLAAAQVQWERSLDREEEKTSWTMLLPTEATSENGTKLIIQDNRSVIARGPNPPTETFTVTATTTLRNITAIRLEALPAGPSAGLPSNGPGRARNGNFVLGEFTVTAEPASDGVAATTRPAAKPVVLQNATASVEQVPFAESLPLGRYAASYAIDGPDGNPRFGWAILPRAGQRSYAVFETAAPLGDGTPLKLTFTLKHTFGTQHVLGRFRLSVTDAPQPVRADPAVDIPNDVRDIAQLPADKRTDAERRTLAHHYRTIAPLLDATRAEIVELETKKRTLSERVPRTLISVSGPPRVTRVIPRGNWLDESGEVVQPAVPHFLRQLDVKPDRRATRLDLANWLVASDNPLVARVFVNRVWALLFGQGLSRSLEDLGSQGDSPTHPELLDWLATDFVAHGWDVKRLVRQMVTSGTYRQTSRPTKELQERDPFNKLLARQGRFRLDAEFVRDNALAISGLLVTKIGGPSVKPYQPPGYWDFLNFPLRTYDQGKGEDLYRRGMYTWWQRTFLNPSLLAFDAPTHEECTAQRPQSNTPQQALTLLNDVTYVEAARVFAARIVKQGGPSDADKLQWAFARAVSRPARQPEVDLLSGMLAKHRQLFATNPGSAEKLIVTGEFERPKDVDAKELAAWTNVARAILNMHETITRN